MAHLSDAEAVQVAVDGVAHVVGGHLAVVGQPEQWAGPG